MKLKRKIVALCFTVLGLFVIGAGGFAQKHFMIASAVRPEVKMQLSGMVERDSTLVPLEKASAVKPGEVLDWTITSENSGSTAALAYKTIGHIPHGTVFIAGSAKADGTVKIVYSIDGGRSYSNQPIIDVKQADGTVKPVPAPVSMYSEIRYEWADPLAQGSKLSASYKVRVK